MFLSSFNRELTRLCVQGGEGEFSRKVRFSYCFRLLSSTVVFSDNVFVTLLPTSVETLKDHCVGQLSVSCFGGQLIV